MLYHDTTATILYLILSAFLEDQGFLVRTLVKLTLYSDRSIVTKLCEDVGQDTPRVNIRTMMSNNIVTTFPEHVKIIVATNPENFVKGKGLGLSE